MRRDDFVDFFAVSDRHLEIHRRLEAWASWVRVRPVGWQVAPMFRQYRAEGSDAREARREPRPVINIPEAVELEKAVSHLPEKHRSAIRWCYVFGGSPGTMARELGVSRQGLMELIQNGRAMLINRRA